jgi:lipopolysaccharide biosynthesis glycosyltransferase
MEKMDIVVCTDKWYVMPTGVMMYSVCVNNTDVDIAFHVICDENVSDKDKYDLEETVTAFKGKTILFYEVDVSLFPSFPRVGGGITRAAYYRLMMSEILSPKVEKVLYLDGDIIVRHSLSDLYYTDLDCYAVAAVTDMSEGVLDYGRLQYPSSAGYFNSGVMLINLKYWREHNVVATFMNYLSEHADLIRLWDQDVLNVVFYDKKKTLPIKYNLQHNFLTNSPRYDFNKYEAEVLYARKDPVIVHYAADNKPWKAYRRGSAHPFSSTFFKYQNKTKWKGVRTDKRSLKMRVINYVADLLRKYGIKPIYNEYIDIAPID